MAALFDRALRRYSDSDFIIQMKSRFFFILCLFLIFCFIVVILYSAIVQLHSGYFGYRVDYKLLLIPFVALILILAITVLLMRGYLALSAHLILILTLIPVWVVMIFIEQSSSITRLDSIVLIIGILTMTPLVVTRNKWLILLYAAVNIAIFICFLYFYQEQIALSLGEMIDYFADNTITFIFISITGFSVFSINKRALDRAEADIAERKRVEKDRDRLEEQLRHAQKLESVGRLAGGVAHDFNNLLTAIIGNTQLMMMEVGPKSVHYPRLEVVMQAADSANVLTRQLLAFSRKQIIEPKVINLNDMIEHMHSMLVRLIGEDIELLKIANAKDARIKADSGQIEQIIVNLVVNARDAMPDGGMLTIETAEVALDEGYCQAHAYAKPGEHVMLAVTDTGHGMGAEVKRHLFEPFFTTKPRGKGTGLGLATVYGAVKQNGGTIEVYSEPGQGTSFKIYFPRVMEEAVQIDKKERPDTSLLRGSETVLLVEDDPRVSEFSLGVLEELGYKVLYASTAEAALTVAHNYEGPIHLLLTDVILPGMNGRALADELKRVRPDIKILFASGYTENIIAHHGVLEEGLHFIGKPFTAFALSKKIREVLDRDGE
jgi:signal transduction histidine kinase/ActR/RegA family two-component response regulator